MSLFNFSAVIFPPKGDKSPHCGLYNLLSPGAKYLSLAYQSTPSILHLAFCPGCWDINRSPASEFLVGFYDGGALARNRS